MKKAVIFSVIFFFFVTVPHVSAEGFTALAPITGLTDAANTSVVNEKTLADFLNNLYKYLIGIAAVLAVIEIIWGGLEISTPDSVYKNKLGKERIYSAIFGLVLVLSPVLVFSVINPNILNLSLNLPKLDTATATSTPGTGPGGGTVDPATGCAITGTLFKKATCSTQQKAQDFATACGSGSGKVMSCQQVNSSGCVDTAYFATCDTTSGSVTGPYVFIDTSESGLSFSGVFNAIAGYYNYEPLAKSASRPDNGQAVLDFVSTCRSDGGTTCLKADFFATTCTFSSGQPASQSNKCYNVTLICVSDKSSFYSTGACSASPNFRIIP